jgi:hypothetical protein
MADDTMLREKIGQIMEAVERIERRFSGINSPVEFLSSDTNHDKLDASAMLLIAIGESFKKSTGKRRDYFSINNLVLTGKELSAFGMCWPMTISTSMWRRSKKSVIAIYLSSK